MQSLIKNLLIALVVVLLFGGAYMFMNSEVADPKSNGEENTDITARTSQILSDTKKIDSYKLDTSIFDDTRFTSLVDQHTTFSDVRAGRVNPFIPVD